MHDSQAFDDFLDPLTLQAQGYGMIVSTAVRERRRFRRTLAMKATPAKRVSLVELALEIVVQAFTLKYATTIRRSKICQLPVSSG